jgi:hypothetical protein
MTDEVQVLQVRVRDKTLNQVDRLKAMVQAPSRSDAVRRAMDITDTLVNAILKGERIIIETQSGKQRQIMIAGLNT